MCNVDVIICAGGSGTRLMPLTAGVNKHLLPMGNVPVICHAVEMAQRVSSRVCVVTEPDAVAPISRVTSGCNFVVQREPAGIADAIRQCSSWSCYEAVLVLLADNLFDAKAQRQICDEAAAFDRGALCFVQKVADPTSYGVLELNVDQQPIGVAEKPVNPKSPYAIVGAYLFDWRVWQRIDKLTRSARGEYEVTDLLRSYISQDDLKHRELDGQWCDIGGSVQEYAECFLNRVKQGKQ